jgi:Na+/H+ antiporter NhaD/arsenite permease-like protein
MLLGIAVILLRWPHFWESHKNKAFFGGVLGLPVVLYVASFDATVVAHTLLEYVSFIALLGALFVISGGIVLRGDIRATPEINTVFWPSGPCSPTSWARRAPACCSSAPCFVPTLPSPLARRAHSGSFSSSSCRIARGSSPARQRSTWRAGQVSETLLAAISYGSVMMGANSCIGNVPNFMVNAIA